MLKVTKDGVMRARCNECGREHSFELRIKGRTPTLKEKQLVTEQASKDQWLCHKEDVYCVGCKRLVPTLVAGAR